MTTMFLINGEHAPLRTKAEVFHRLADQHAEAVRVGNRERADWLKRKLTHLGAELTVYDVRALYAMHRSEPMPHVGALGKIA